MTLIGGPQEDQLQRRAAALSEMQQISARQAQLSEERKPLARQKQDPIATERVAEIDSLKRQLGSRSRTLANQVTTLTSAIGD